MTAFWIAFVAIFAACLIVVVVTSLIEADLDGIRDRALNGEDR